MRILVATGAPTLPQMIGGSQRSGDALIKGLQSRGHEVAIFAGLDGKGPLAWRARLKLKFSQKKTVIDHVLGYPAYRSWFPIQNVQEIIDRFDPDAVIVLAHDFGRIGRAFHSRGVPVVFNFQDVEYQKFQEDLSSIKPLVGVANSKFTANVYERQFSAKCTMIHPIIDKESYITNVNGEYVTFVNPSAVKGIDKSIEIARLLPQIKFLFQETWPMSEGERSALTTLLDGLDNVILRPTVADMRAVYAKTRILLCPSQWGEGYGRIATEAQLSGIPVVASDRGGLPEAVGSGGFIIPADADAQTWSLAVQTLWEDGAKWQELSQNALSHSRRVELDMNFQLDHWEAAISEALTDIRGTGSE